MSPRLLRSPLSQALLFALLAPAAMPVARAAAALPEVEVVGDAAEQQQKPGSVTLLEAQDLVSARVLTVNEALRKVPGVNVRDEEGFGLRPNIGIRGLNPTRSTKVLLLEDGLPAAYAPYGDNASYYHAPVDRYESIEVMKGVDMLRFGPQTIGGVINYVTPEPPQEFGGQVQLMAGTRDYANAQLRVGGGGALLDFTHKQGDGARDNLELEQTDLNGKYALDLRGGGALVLRANLMREDSQVTYSGITDAEYRNFGRAYNPFDNDHFDIDRSGASATHEIAVAPDAMLTTSVYWFHFSRDWWRQSSTTTDTQCGNAFRDARFRGEAVHPDACNSRQGRLRDYYTRGIEPRLSVFHGLFGAENELELGLRFHAETQERRQVNAASAFGETGTLAENNRRTTDATAAFVQNRFRWGAFSLVPGVRLESIDYGRVNRLTERAGEDEVHEVIPGLGLAWSFGPDLLLFAGAHEGFAPPRAEDIIDNAGGSIDVDAEKSLNVEVGLRGKFAADMHFELALFQNDFDNQVAVGSIAGGSTPLAQGEATYRGAELALGWEREGAFGTTGTPYAELALTALPTARQDSPFVAVANGQVVGGSAAGKRLPYAPRLLTTVRAGYRIGAWDASAEVQGVDDQYTDFANTQEADPLGNGQVGRIAGHATVNLALNWSPAGNDWSAFATVKNLADREYIVDRTRGIQLGNPRQLVLGLSYAF